MIDIHSHILPGVDDGATTIRGSVEMCKMAFEDGCEAMIATPHQRHPLWSNDNPSRLMDLLSQLTRELDSGPELHLGGEIRIDSEGLLEALARLPASTVCPLADSRYLLLEFGRRGPQPQPEGIIHEIVIEGWIPILAHPECVPWLARDLGLLERLLDLGAYSQLTTSSLLGDFGPGPCDAAHRMISRGLAHFVASDCHDMLQRPPGLSEAFGYISDTWNERTAKALLQEHPECVVLGQPMPAGAVA